MKLLDNFLLYMKGNAASDTTISNYQHGLEYFFKYMSVNTDDNILTITQKNVVDYLQYVINEKHLEPSTRNTYLTAIKAMYLYLKSVVKVNIDNDILDIPYIDTPIKQAIFLDDVEAELLLKTVTDVRSRAIIGLLLKTGIRISELVNIKLTDMEKDIDELGYHYYIIKIHGKGNKERYIYTNYELATWIDKYMGKRRNMALAKNQDFKEYLFLSNNGYQIDVSNLRKMTKYWARQINFKYADKFSPHKLRHTYATLMLAAEEYIEDENGERKSMGKRFDIKTVSESMGHANLQTTNRYAHTTEKRISAMQRKGW